jgi:hypothetical protein
MYIYTQTDVCVCVCVCVCICIYIGVEIAATEPVTDEELQILKVIVRELVVQKYKY